jgi:hypothetical protein
MTFGQRGEDQSSGRAGQHAGESCANGRARPSAGDKTRRASQAQSH